MVRTDDEGYLIDPGDWNEDVAAELALREGLALTGLQDCRYAPAAGLEHRIEVPGSAPRTEILP
jgi:hypothetical protein